MRILLALTVLLSSCLSVEKATDYLKKKEKLDDVCKENFPIKGDSSVYVYGDTAAAARYKRIADSLQQVVEVARNTVEYQYKDTCNEKNTGMPVVPKDSLVKIQKLLTTLSRELDRLRADLARKPAPDTVKVWYPDPYALASLEQELKTTQGERNTYKAKFEWWRKAALFSSGILLLMFIFFILRTLYRMKKLNVVIGK